MVEANKISPLKITRSPFIRLTFITKEAEMGKNE
jgi:hypothetical protein